MKLIKLIKKFFLESFEAFPYFTDQWNNRKNLFKSSLFLNFFSVSLIFVIPNLQKLPALISINIGIPQIFLSPKFGCQLSINLSVFESSGIRGPSNACLFGTSDWGFWEYCWWVGETSKSWPGERSGAREQGETVFWEN